MEPTELELPDGDSLLPSQEPAPGTITPLKIPTRHNPKLARIIARVNEDEEVFALWECANKNAVDRLGMSDHGPIHVRIVANIALRMHRLLTAAGITPSVVKDHGLAPEDAEVVTVLASLTHDLGMSIHRTDHEQFSLFIAQEKIREWLAGVYPVREATILRSEILHAIISHRSGGRPLTLEGGIVRVADALDMSKGRSRIPFETGQINIHSLSAAAVDRVDIVPGEDKPIHIAITMSNSAGIFQVDELLREKLKGSGLEPYVEVEAAIRSDQEKKLVHVVRL